MTTYILHGGAYYRDSATNNAFFAQFTSLVHKDKVKVLMCYWARNEDQWETLFTRDRALLYKQSTKQVDAELVDTIENLFAKLKSADVLFVSGGEQKFLGTYIEKLSPLKSRLQDKIYIGSSMGAFLPSQSYILSFEKLPTHEIYKGLGFIPYNVLCHWNIETHKEEKITILKEKYPDVPILLLNEENFTTLTI